VENVPASMPHGSGNSGDRGRIHAYNKAVETATHFRVTALPSFKPQILNDRKFSTLKLES